ncbi:MAG: CCA tRNA nucleotidyltransferase [Actinomycetota bacterium]|nr:MAG: CCA tRNA nucleotidyltransferase [Actinomycetota bacterium]
MPAQPPLTPSASSAAAAAQRRAAAGLVPVLPLLTDLGKRFAAAGHELALVGGSVRDALLGRADLASADLDLATDAPPERVLELLADWADTTWEAGIRFGTVGVRRGDRRLEITTYRTERYDPDSRKPSVAYGDTLAGDLARRDFTVNALAVTLPDLAFVDLHGGLADLAAGVLRTPGAPEDSFGDDPLRMLRAARFTAQLGFDLDPAAVTAITAMADRLAIVSAERVRDEFSRLLLSAEPRRGLGLLVDTGLSAQVLPELAGLRLEIDEHHRHKDVYEHTLIVLEQAMDLETAGPDLVLRLAALLHDIGKPRTRRFSGDGRVSFHHHEVVGARMTTKRLQALRYPNDIVEAVSTLVELHLRFHGYGTGAWTDSAVRRYVRDAGPLLGRLHQLTRADCTTRNRRKALALQRAYDELEARIETLGEAEELAAIRPDLDGNAIMAVLGIPPGREVGEAYRFLLELRLDQGPLGEEAAADALRQWWAQRQG